MADCPEESASVCDHRVTHLVGCDGAQLMRSSGDAHPSSPPLLGASKGAPRQSVATLSRRGRACGQSSVESEFLGQPSNLGVPRVLGDGLDSDLGRLVEPEQGSPSFLDAVERIGCLDAWPVVEDALALVEHYVAVIDLDVLTSHHAEQISLSAVELEQL